MTDDQPKTADDRGPEPGRRDDDFDRAQVRAWVRSQVRSLSWKWAIVWSVTLLLSAFGAYRAAAPSEDAKSAANAAKSAAAQAQASVRRADSAAAESRRLAAEANARAAIVARQSREACLRTRRYSPALARAYAKYKILSPEQLRDYRAGIPRRC